MATLEPVSVTNHFPEFSATPDPWGYKTNPEDAMRKKIILNTLDLYAPFWRALDLGAHEGWITQDLPAVVKHGHEMSDPAAARFPPNVQRACEGTYDLVIATGVLYQHYSWENLIALMHQHADGIILTCNIMTWESPAAILGVPGRQVIELEFPYREYVQKLRVFDTTLRPIRK